MTPTDRAHGSEVVANEDSVPVLAGTGHAGLASTLNETARAADAGTDGALLITTNYFSTPRRRSRPSTARWPT